MLERLFISYRDIDDESINIDEFNLEDEKKYAVLLAQAYDFNPKGADEEDVFADYTKTLGRIVSAYTKIKDIKKILSLLPSSGLDDDKISAPLIASAKAEIKNIYFRQADLHILESTSELKNIRKRYEKTILSATLSHSSQENTYVRKPTPQYQATKPIEEPSLWESKSRNATRKKDTFLQKILPFNNRASIIILVSFVVALIIIAMLAFSLSDIQGADETYHDTNNSTPNNSNYKPNTSKPQLTPVAEPRTGAILSGLEYYDESELTIRASGGHSYVVKLKNSSGVTRLSFYVRAGDTVTVNVPSEYLYVYFASGDTWYGNEHLFGKETSYSMDDEIQNFIDYNWEYTLYPVTNGNFSETPISADQFN